MYIIIENSFRTSHKRRPIAEIFKVVISYYFTLPTSHSEIFFLILRNFLGNPFTLLLWLQLQAALNFAAARATGIACRRVDRSLRSSGCDE